MTFAGGSAGGAPAGWKPYSRFMSNWAEAWDIWLSAAASREEIAARAARRFVEIVQFARDHSPYYAEIYQPLKRAGIELRDVPPVTRRELMARFDEWATDPQVTQTGVREFVADPARAGWPYLGRYAVWTSSGTTGEPGLFLHDEHALGVYEALETLRLGRGPLAPGFVGDMLLGGGRYAMVGATGGHFAGNSSVERLRQLLPVFADRLRVFSILDPLPRLIEALNDYQPSFVATYPTVASLLAEEKRGGRLGITPAALWLGGESLSAACRAELSATFRCRILEEYGASEFMSIGCECGQGRLHLNSDRVLAEPVDRDYRPVPPGVVSHTVLLTNLANRVQPIIRYDLGDSIALCPDPCACGSPFPAFSVEGRCDDVLHCRGPGGDPVGLLPLALTTVVEEFAGAHRFQIVQERPDAIGVRLDAPLPVDRPALWVKVERALRAYLDQQGLPGVAVYLDTAPLERSSRSGKLRRVIALRAEWRGE